MRDEKYLTKASKFLALVLRHKPSEANIYVDNHGWANVKLLLKGINDNWGPLTLTELEAIVEKDDKGRYAFDKYHERIRAVQGHSFPVDLELESQIPPEILYHGTSDKYIDNIMKEGLIPKSRQYVHLSNNTFTAYKVGERHGGKPVLCIIDAKSMHKNGYKFYVSENGVWLIDKVPCKYFTAIHVTKENYTDKVNDYLQNLNINCNAELI